MFVRKTRLATEALLKRVLSRCTTDVSSLLLSLFSVIVSVLHSSLALVGSSDLASSETINQLESYFARVRLTRLPEHASSLLKKRVDCIVCEHFVLHDLLPSIIECSENDSDVQLNKQHLSYYYQDYEVEKRLPSLYFHTGEENLYVVLSLKTDYGVTLSQSSPKTMKNTELYDSIRVSKFLKGASLGKN